MMKDNGQVIDKSRAAYITIYDLQGGPFPERALKMLEREVTKVAEAYNLAVTIVEE